MPANQTWKKRAAVVLFAMAVWTAPAATEARVVCQSPDGSIYATDNPPPGCYVVSPSRDPEGAAPFEPPDAPNEAMQAVGTCEQAVAEVLQNASQASWPSRDTYRVRNLGSSGYTIEGSVEVQQPLATMRTPWTCQANRSHGDRWQGIATLGEATLARDGSTTAEAPPPIAAPPRTYEPPRAYERSGPSSEPPPMVASRPSTGAEGGKWGGIGSCRRARIVDAYAERHAAQRMQVVKGTLEYAGEQPIRYVSVCASGTCAELSGAYPPLEQGARQPFSITVPSLQQLTVTAQCSRLELE